jgi:hypothetical protein
LSSKDVNNKEVLLRIIKSYIWVYAYKLLKDSDLVSDEIKSLLESEMSNIDNDIIFNPFWTDFDQYDNFDITLLKNLNIQRESDYKGRCYINGEYWREEEIYETTLWTLTFNDYNYYMDRDKIFFSILLRKGEIEYLKNSPSHYTKCFSIIDSNWFNNIMPVHTFCKILWINYDSQDDSNIKNILDKARIKFL